MNTPSGRKSQVSPSGEEPSSHGDPPPSRGDPPASQGDPPPSRDKISTSRGGANALWGGRFEGGADAALEALNVSIDFDRRLAAEDLQGSRAHGRMLARCGIIAAAEAETLLAGLDRVEAEIEAGSFPYSRALEDIHMNIEARLRHHAGSVAGKLHTGRSRNDQTATALRLYVRGRIDVLDASLRALQEAFLRQAEAHAETTMPGFTHLQIAQPVTFGFHCLAYAAMFGRDRERFADARRRVNRSPLGAAALAGTSHPIDRETTARELGFEGTMENALDAVSDRDFVLETLAAATLTALHLSRLAEEIVLWSSPLFGFVRVSEGFSTGSSIMPQKRNPDAAELLRGKTGRIAAAFQSVAMMMKGLPLGYSKDMQEDKEPLFDALDALRLCLTAAAGMTDGLIVNAEAMKRAAAMGFSTATDIADWLTREADLPFRDAHRLTGEAVAAAERRGVALKDVSTAEAAAIHPRLPEALATLGDPAPSAASRVSSGGAAPVRVREGIERLRLKLAAEADRRD